MDKENAHARRGVFMIDASKGFVKDGNKNRLREQDIRKIVTAFNERKEIPGFSRMVPLEEIADPINDFNLNIPRYIDSNGPEDLHDLNAHLNGGIPDRDIDALSDYWDAFPALRGELFQRNGCPGYSEARMPPAEVKAAVLENDDFRAYRAQGRSIFDDWHAVSEPILLGIDASANPREIGSRLSEDILERFSRLPLLDPYDIYQLFMDYWNDVLQDDLYLITSEGWDAARELRRPEGKEEADFTIKDGRRTSKYVSDLIPPSLIIANFFAAERRELDDLEATEARLRGEKEEFEETHTVDGGVLDGLEGSRGITKGNVQQRVMELKELVLKTFRGNSPEYKQAKAIAKTTFGVREWKKGVVDEDGLFAELDVLHEWLRMDSEALDRRKSCAAKLNDLYKDVRAKYATITDDEIKALLVDHKWFDDIRAAVDAEIERIMQRLAQRVQTLEERYANSLPELERSVYDFGELVSRHIREMGGRYVV